MAVARGANLGLWSLAFWKPPRDEARMNANYNGSSRLGLGGSFTGLNPAQPEFRPVVYGRYSDLSELGKAAFSGLSKGPWDDPR